MARHIAGEPQDFSAVLLDTHAVPPFLLRAQRAAQRIPPGQTITYSELAARAGSPHAVRAAGQAMARNRWPILVPCHRVVGCAGYGDYSAASGLHTKLRLLWREGYRGRTSNVGFDEHAAIAHLRTVDVKLRKVIDRAGPFTLYARAPHAMRALPDEEIVQRLVRHHGVEPWQARMWLLFGLGRPDVLPSSDRLLRKGFAISRGLAEIPAASAIEEAGAAWAPFRSVASWYLWRAVELAS
jgi:O-6-methylguanine DNA methyltransferase